MKTKVFLKTVALSAVILFGIAASAANKNNLIYNSEEKEIGRASCRERV